MSDWTVRDFLDLVRAELGFLVVDYGFEEPAVVGEEGADPGRRLTNVLVVMRSPRAVVVVGHDQRREIGLVVREPGAEGGYGLDDILRFAGVPDLGSYAEIYTDEGGGLAGALARQARGLERYGRPFLAGEREAFEALDRFSRITGALHMRQYELDPREPARFERIERAWSRGDWPEVREALRALPGPLHPAEEEALEYATEQIRADQEG